MSDPYKFQQLLVQEMPDAGLIVRFKRSRISEPQYVDEVREAGVLVVSLNMAGSVPDHADLVVTDPLQAGVMTVMAVASTASFDVSRANHRRY